MKPLIYLLRLGFCAALLIWLVHSGKVDPSILTDVLRELPAHPGQLAAALILLLPALLSVLARWYLLIHAHRLPVPFGRITLIFAIGQFFNAFMPGGCGGDLGRIYYAAREVGARRIEVAATVLADRAVGLLVQMIFCAAAFALQFAQLVRLPDATWTFGILCAVLAAALAAVIALFYRNLFDRWPVLAAWAGRRPVLGAFRRVYEAFYYYKGQPAVLGGAVLLSVVNLLFQVLNCQAFGNALEIDATFRDYLVFFPVISVLTSLPLTPGGFGVRESLFVMLFAGIGIPGHQAIALSLLVYAGGLFWSLVGGIPFLLYPAFRQTPKEMSEEQHG